MPDDVFDALVTAQRTVADCQQKLRELRAQLDSDDADVRALASRQWDETNARYRAALGEIERLQEAGHARK